MQKGLNINFYKKLAATYKKINFIVSGGVSTYADIIALNNKQIYGAVIGKALHEKKIDLRKAIALC
jgi:phosphoribosylformimino-5-aminoimidazole carboxamide ribotide isomerase